MIDERPQSIEDRKEIGHWEGDTVIGKSKKDCLVTLVERVTGYTAIGKIPARTVGQTNACIIRLLGKMKDIPVQSITLDNGTEFHGYRHLEQMMKIPIYFAFPYHSWERGTNENTNGLIRQYVPKTHTMIALNQTHCTNIAKELNDRPRKRLGWKTPNEAMYDISI
jgi:transposase, IS30 family